jgi:hypothetical protein
MTATLIQQSGLAADNGFQTRVHMAMMAEASVVAAAAIGSLDLAAYELRIALAAKILAAGGSAQLTAFAYAVACNATVTADLGTAVSIAATAPGPPAVITTVAAHGMSTGNTAKVVNTLDTVVAGTWTVTVIDSTDFSVPVSGTASEGPGGQATQQPSDSDIATAVAAVWSAVAGVTSAT